VRSGFDISELYRRIDRLNVHSDREFTCIVFSDTILVYGVEGWNKYPSHAIMWLIEFAQDLFYNLISIDVHIRAYVTKGDFEHHKLRNIEFYYGSALIDCYEREKKIKCTGVFLDSRLAPLSDIFHLTKYDEDSHFVHVMQHLRRTGLPESAVPRLPTYCCSETTRWANSDQSAAQQVERPPWEGSSMFSNSLFCLKRPLAPNRGRGRAFDAPSAAMAASAAYRTV